MIQAIGPTSRNDDLPDAEERRRLERRRWFESVVMLPVSLGMLTSFLAGAIGTFAHGPLLRLDQFVCHCSIPDAVEYSAAALPAVFAVAISGFAMTRWHRR